MAGAAASKACETVIADLPGQGAQAALGGPLVAREGELLPPVPAVKQRPLGGRHAGYRQPERMRGRIQTGVLLQRLHKITKGLVPGTPPQLMVQVAAAKVLLAKSLPDLQTVELTGDADRPLVILTRME